MICYSKLDISFPTFELQQELEKYQGAWMAHLNTRHYEGGWNVIALKAPGGESNKIVADLNGGSAYEETPELHHFPSVVKLLATLECETMSVRLLNLKAGALIKKHKDQDLSFEQGECRLHFPIITNTEVYFYVNKERILLKEGECWYINANLPHKVENKGTEDRIHLVIDCKVNPWLSDLINTSEKKEIENPDHNKDLDKIIEALKLQNTPTSLKLAADLQQQLEQ